MTKERLKASVHAGVIKLDRATFGEDSSALALSRRIRNIVNEMGSVVEDQKTIATAAKELAGFLNLQVEQEDRAAYKDKEKISMQALEGVQDILEKHFAEYFDDDAERDELAQEIYDAAFAPQTVVAQPSVKKAGKEKAAV